MTIHERRPVSDLIDIVTDNDGKSHIRTGFKGLPLLRFVLVNKGTAFTDEERKDLGLCGLLPPRISTMEEQLERCYQQYQQHHSDLDKHVFLRELQENQEVLFYALVERHLVEMIPIIYTPTVGDAIEQFSEIFRNPRGLTVSAGNVERLDDVLEDYPLKDVRMIVATDSSAILGIGDQGYGGLGIAIGKLSLYTVGGGISPFHTMPVGLDVGTDREDLLEQPLYLGAQHERLQGDAYLSFIDNFVDSISTHYPDAIIQWEDLSKEAAFTVLERYRKKVPCFNDDIQGTGGVALAGVVAATRRKGTRLQDERVLVYGAGAGGVGVADAIRKGMIREGLTHEEASQRIFVLDSGGLLLEGRSRVDGYKTAFAHKREWIDEWTWEGDAPNLEEVVKQGKVTCLIGLSGQPRSFSKDLIKEIQKHTDRPIVFPLSNPTRLSEALPVDVIQWTDGKAMVATGSPFLPVEHKGTKHVIGQGNNAFIFPGLGLGAMLARVSEITDGMVLAAAYALVDYTTTTYADENWLYPPLSDLQAVSRVVAKGVIEQAVKDGVAREELPTGDALTEFIDTNFWRAEYLPVRHAPPTEEP